MHAMTISNLQSAFSGESQAHMRYMIYSDRAERDGFPKVALLFRGIAFAERIHATNHFQVLREQVGTAQTVAGGGFGLGPTAQNLKVAIEGEEFEVNEMYPAYMVVADSQGEKAAIRSFHGALEAEKTHAAFYKQALEAVEKGKDADVSMVSVCSVCGYTVLGEAPEVCPICGAKRDKFRSFE